MKTLKLCVSLLALLVCPLLGAQGPGNHPMFLTASANRSIKPASKMSP